MRVGEYKLHVSEKVRMYMNQTNDICEYVVIQPSVAQERLSEARERRNGVILLDGLDKALVGTFLNENGHVVAVYAEELCLALIAERLKKEHPDRSTEGLNEEAADYLGDLGRVAPYMRGAAPVIIEGFEVDSGVWRCFLEGSVD